MQCKLCSQQIDISDRFCKKCGNVTDTGKLAQHYLDIGLETIIRKRESEQNQIMQFLNLTFLILGSIIFANMNLEKLPPTLKVLMFISIILLVACYWFNWKDYHYKSLADISQYIAESGPDAISHEKLLINAKLNYKHSSTYKKLIFGLLTVEYCLIMSCIFGLLFPDVFSRL